MNPATLLFEFPLNERIRTYLRLEQLFKRIALLLPRSHSLDHHYALSEIFELVEIAARTDIRSEVLKDVERNKQQLVGYRGNPNVSESALENVIGKLDQYYSQLGALTAKPGQDLLDNDWLTSIRSRINMAASTCEFDLPHYHRWLNGAAEKRQADLKRWMATLNPLGQAVVVLLKLLRDAGTPQPVIAPNGFLQHNLPSARQCQLARVLLATESKLVPEFSGNRLILSIRFSRRDQDARPAPAGEDVSFDLTLCA